MALDIGPLLAGRTELPTPTCPDCHVNLYYEATVETGANLHLLLTCEVCNKGYSLITGWA